MPRIITLTPNPALDLAFEAVKIEPSMKLRCTDPRVDPGGGGINVSRAAQRLGADTLAIFTAGGAYGAGLREAVASENLAVRIIPIASSTRPAFHAYESSTGAQYRFNFPGEEMTADEAAAMLSALEEETHAGDFVVGSGSLPPGAPREFWARAARIAREKGARFALDSSSAAREALAEGISLLRLNKNEAPALAGRALEWPQGYEDFAKSIIAEGGAERVVVTHAGDGGLMASAKGVLYAPSPKVKVVSAVGAGDSFVGALIVALLEGKADEEALRFAFAAASAALTTPGTQLFDPDTARKIYEGSPV